MEILHQSYVLYGVRSQVLRTCDIQSPLNIASQLFQREGPWAINDCDMRLLNYRIETIYKKEMDLRPLDHVMCDHRSITSVVKQL